MFLNRELVNKLKIYINKIKFNYYILCCIRKFDDYGNCWLYW